MRHSLVGESKNLQGCVDLKKKISYVWLDEEECSILCVLAQTANFRSNQLSCNKFFKLGAYFNKIMYLCSFNFLRMQTTLQACSISWLICSIREKRSMRNTRFCYELCSNIILIKYKSEKIFVQRLNFFDELHIIYAILESWIMFICVIAI